MTTIEAYRTDHRIEPVKRGRDGQLVCAVDRISIWPTRRKGRFYHDPGEVAEAAEAARRLAIYRERHFDL